VAPPPPRKPLVTPSAPMKPLYWTKVVAPHSTASLLWDDLEDVEVPADKIEELFAKARPKKLKVEELKKEKEDKKPEKVKVVKLIDAKKGQNVGIFVKSMKLSAAAVEAICYRLEFAGDLETLATLRTNQATEEELLLLREHTLAPAAAPLDAPDQFLLDVAGLHMVDARLACLMCKVSLADRVAEVEVRVANIASCSTFLATDPALRQVLGVILTCGNHLNGGNKQRGQAIGFGVDILPKLKDLKATSNTDNLLGFVVRFCIESFDGERGTARARLPVPEPGDLEKCRNVDFDQEKAACGALVRELREVRARVDRITATAAEDAREPFLAIMTEFLARADREVGELAAQVEEAADKFVETMRAYRFVPKKGRVEEAKPAEFYEPWYLFAEDYKGAWKKEQRLVETELAKAARQEEVARKASLRTAALETKKTPVGGLKDRLLRKKSKSYSSFASALGSSPCPPAPLPPLLDSSALAPPSPPHSEPRDA